MSAKRVVRVLTLASFCIPAMARADDVGGRRKASSRAQRSFARQTESDVSYQHLVDHVKRMGIANEIVRPFDVDPSAMGGDPCAPMPNGCGPGGLIPFFANCPFDLVCFEEACNGHDTCYSTCGAEQFICDVYFGALMLNICDNTFSPDDDEYQTCRAIAYVYFTLVFYFGEGFYDDAQGFFCACESGTPATSPDTNVSRRLGMARPFVDDDRDLLPDRWERAVGLNVGNIDSFDDSDGDGLINLAEFIHGTDPFNADTNGDGVDDASEVFGSQRVRRNTTTRR